VGPGIVLNKDGSFMRLAYYRGPDLESATEAELIAVTARINNVLKRFDSGWALFFEAARKEASSYPLSNFPDPVSLLVDEERRKGFEAEAGHFESAYTLALCWLPPAETQDKAGSYLVERGEDDRGALNGATLSKPRRNVHSIFYPPYCLKCASSVMKRH
jgi:type IV secretion system protein TrbE